MTTTVPTTAEKRPTAKQNILKLLHIAGRPLAIHELDIPRASQNAVGTRLPELARAGLVSGSIRDGEPFKEWQLTPTGRVVAMGL